VGLWVESDRGFSTDRDYKDMMKNAARIKCTVVMAFNSIANCLLGALFFAGNAHGALIDQPITYTYKNGGKLNTLSFPFVRVQEPIVAFRINNFLHLTVLEISPPSDAVLGPVPLPVEDGIAMNYATIESLGAQITNDRRVISVGYVSRGRGNSFEDRTRYEFDSNTGRVLLKEELLTPEGKELIAKRVWAERKARIKRELSRLSDLAASPKKISRSGDSREIIGDKIELYEECLEKFSGSGAESIDIHNPGIMNVVDGGLRFSQPACSGQAIDDLQGFQNVLAAAQLKPYLSKYGRYILLGERDYTIAPINPYAQVFRGTIGGAPITLYLGSDSVQVDPNFQNARYYYNKYGKVIPLAVARNDDVYEFTETESAERPKPVFRFRMTGSKLTGKWHGSGKVLDFSAAP
jgi:hypothetical protein